jgi:hypothetical protein
MKTTNNIPELSFIDIENGDAFSNLFAIRSA